MKSLIVVFGALLLIACLPSFFQFVHDARTDDTSQNFAGVTTAAGITTANVTLSRAVHDNNLASITLVSSNITGDSPTATGYNSVSRIVGVSGLSDNQTRTLAIDFEIDSQIIPAGMSTFLTMLQWFYIFIIIGMLGGAVYAFFD